MKQKKKPRAINSRSLLKKLKTNEGILALPPGTTPGGLVFPSPEGEG